MKISLSVEIWYLVPWMCGTTGTTSTRVARVLDDRGTSGEEYFKTRKCFKTLHLSFKKLHAMLVPSTMQCWYQVPRITYPLF